MKPTHYAVIVSSQRMVPVIRMGRLLMVLHTPSKGQQPVSTCRYDKRFALLPADMNLRHSIQAMARADKQANR